MVLLLINIYYIISLITLKLVLLLAENACSKDNGGCQDLCIPLKGDSKTCMCSDDSTDCKIGLS